MLRRRARAIFRFIIHSHVMVCIAKRSREPQKNRQNDLRDSLANFSSRWQSWVRLSTMGIKQKVSVQIQLACIVLLLEAGIFRKTLVMGEFEDPSWLVHLKFFGLVFYRQKELRDWKGRAS